MYYLKSECLALLQNNDAPSESTILEVTESRKAPLSELQEVESEIQRLDELMDTLKMRRQTIQKIINDHNIILSPVRGLPPDVLQEIFFHCLPTHHNPIIKSSEPPLLLTRICSSWRAIALSSPRIWSKIHIPLPGDPSLAEFGREIVIAKEPRLSNRRQIFSRLMRLRCEAARTWLSRSGTCPLSLSVAYAGQYSGVQNSKDDELIRELFDILLSYADRWSDVSLAMPQNIYHALQGDIEPTKFLSLKALKVNLYQKLFEYDFTPYSYTRIRLLGVPSLRRITVIGDGTLANPGSIKWNHFTHITFGSSVDDVYLLRVLRRCPNLVFGKFRVNESLDDGPKVVQNEILLPRLESLVIKNSGDHKTMTILFNAIKAPALTKLSYQCQWFASDCGNHSFTPTPVIPLLENSTLISNLSLRGGLSSEDTEECLRRGAQVTHVVFGRSPPRDANGRPSYFIYTDPDVTSQDPFDFRILSVGSPAVTLLPRLESLEAYHRYSFTDEDLLGVITSRIDGFRRGQTAALKSIKIHFMRRRQKDITEDVSRLAKEAGIEVKLELTYPPESSQFLERLSPSFKLTPNEDEEDLLFWKKGK